MSIGIATKGFIAQLNTQIQDCADVFVGVPEDEIVSKVTDETKVIVDNGIVITVENNIKVISDNEIIVTVGECT